MLLFLSASFRWTLISQVRISSKITIITTLTIAWWWWHKCVRMIIWHRSKCMMSLRVRLIHQQCRRLMRFLLSCTKIQVFANVTKTTAEQFSTVALVSEVSRTQYTNTFTEVVQSSSLLLNRKMWFMTMWAQDILWTTFSQVVPIKKEYHHQSHYWATIDNSSKRTSLSTNIQTRDIRSTNINIKCLWRDQILPKVTWLRWKPSLISIPFLKSLKTKTPQYLRLLTSYSESIRFYRLREMQTRMLRLSRSKCSTQFRKWSSIKIIWPRSSQGTI